LPLKTQLERVSKGKPSSLLGLAVSDEEKKFYDVDTWSSKKMTAVTVGVCCRMFRNLGSNSWLVKTWVTFVWKVNM
jgi:hypothetical protein